MSDTSARRDETMERSRTDDRVETTAGSRTSRDVITPARSSRLTTDVREQQRRVRSRGHRDAVELQLRDYRRY